MMSDSQLIEEIEQLKNRSREPQQLLARTLELLQSARPSWHWAGVYLMGQDGKLHLGPYTGKKTEHTVIAIGDGVCGTAVAQGKNQIIDDVTSLDNYIACSLETRSEIVVLIRCKDEIVGQFDIDSDDPGAFNKDDEELLEKLAELLSEEVSSLRPFCGSQL